MSRPLLEGVFARLALLLVLAAFLAPGLAFAESESRSLDPDAIDAMLRKRVENQAKWADYSALVTSRLLVDGEEELTMVHRATFDIEGQVGLELVREQPVKGGVFTRAIRSKKKRELEEWRDRLLGVLNYYWSVSAGQARDWMKRATLRTDAGEGVSEHVVEGSGYAMPQDLLTVVRRDGESLPDAIRVRTLVKERHVELNLTMQALGETGIKVPSQATAEVKEERLRLALRYEGWEPR